MLLSLMCVLSVSQRSYGFNSFSESDVFSGLGSGVSEEIEAKIER
jgi:hypothetical protein